MVIEAAFALALVGIAAAVGVRTMRQTGRWWLGMLAGTGALLMSVAMLGPYVMEARLNGCWAASDCPGVP